MTLLDATPYDPAPARRRKIRILVAVVVILVLAAVAWMNRGLHYSLNFYLREEIRTWDQDHPTEGYVIAGSKDCKRLAPPSFACEEIPFDLESTGSFLYRVSLVTSTSGLPRGGQPQ